MARPKSSSSSSSQSRSQSHKRSISLFGIGGGFSPKENNNSDTNTMSYTATATATTKTYGRSRKAKPSHKSVLTQSHIDERLWAQPESASAGGATAANGSATNRPLVGLGVLDFEANKENDTSSWETETTQQILKQTLPPSRSNSGIKPSASNNSLSSAKGALSKMARALSTMSTSSISSKGTVEPNEKHFSLASTVSTIGKGGGGYTRISVGSSTKRDSSILNDEYSSPGGSSPSLVMDDREYPSTRNITPSSIQTRRANYNSQKDLSLVLKESNTKNADQKLDANHDNNDYILEAPPKMPVVDSSTPVLTPKSSTASIKSSLKSSLKSKDSRYNLASSPSAASFLSYKKEGSEIKHKKISKTHISGPSGLVDTSEYFDGRETASIASTSKGSGHGKRRSGHKNGSSIFSSISSASLFSMANNDSYKRNGSVSSAAPAFNCNNSNTDMTNNLNNTPSTPKKRSAFSDVKKSFLSASSSLFNKHGTSGTPKSAKQQQQQQQSDKPMISLPTPSDTSREKLQNKLRASNSLMSLARSDTSGSLIAVPAKQYQQNQLESLLGLCNSSAIVDFDSYINEVSKEGLSKLAEASFSEVYIQRKKSTSKIYKVIPFGNEELEQLPVQDIIQELSIARLLMSMDGFIDVIDAAVVRGTYPEELLQLWDDYAAANNSENHRPDFFQSGQLYCIMVMSNAGTDLEHFELTSWQEAESIFWQTVKCLAQAEEKYRFEHRDLHWGNLVIRTSRDQVEEELEDMMDDLSLNSQDLKVTLIDYTLSRATNSEGNTIFTRLDHPDFFRGKGDYQFDIYRFMRNQVVSMQSSVHSPMINTSNNSPNPGAPGAPPVAGSPFYSSTGASLSTASFHSNTSYGTSRECDWSVFCPKTNVLWLHYIVDKLINAKGLQRVVTTRSGRLSVGGGSSESLRDAYKNGTSVINEEANACKIMETVHSTIDPRKKRFGSNKKGQPMSFQDFHSAQHVLLWGQRNNYIPSSL